MVPPKVGKDKDRNVKHQHSNGSTDEGLLTPNVLTPGLTPTSPYTPGIFVARTYSQFVEN